MSKDEVLRLENNSKMEKALFLMKLKKNYPEANDYERRRIANAKELSYNNEKKALEVSANGTWINYSVFFQRLKGFGETFDQYADRAMVSIPGTWVSRRQNTSRNRG